jgi:Spy/CpxP family protein refolding chaperone
MKKFLLPLLALALSATAAAAQTTPDQAGGRPQRTPEEMAARQTQGLTRQLGLSADQSAKVQQILLARDQEMLAMRGQMQAGTADRRQLREQLMAGRAKYDDQLKAVLTPDQYAKMQAMQASRRQRGGMQLPEDGKVKAKDGKLKIKAKTDA